MPIRLAEDRQTASIRLKKLSKRVKDSLLALAEVLDYVIYDNTRYDIVVFSGRLPECLVKL